MLSKAASFLSAFWILGFMVAAPARAHESTSHHVIITHPWAMAAKAGENTRVYMVIENEETENITVTGLETPVARRAQFRFQADSETVASLSSRSILPEEALNVGTSHMWFELVDLRRDLVMGSQFKAALKRADGRSLDLTGFVGHTHKNTGPKGS